VLAAQSSQLARNRTSNLAAIQPTKRKISRVWIKGRSFDL
jgi:hypothetical protein